MTFHEWRDLYCGKGSQIEISTPYEKSPDVYLVLGDDPLLDRRRVVPVGAISLLRTLTDYRVTSELPARGTLWLAPMSDRDDWTRGEYMDHRCTHHEYYLSIARLLGYEAITRMVVSVFGPALIRGYEQDPEHFNGPATPLGLWDAMDHAIRSMVSEQNRSKNIMARTWDGAPLTPGQYCWSLSESVCTAKAAAKEYCRQAAATS